MHKSLLQTSGQMDFYALLKCEWKKEIFFVLMGYLETEWKLSFAAILLFSTKPSISVFSHQHLNVISNILFPRKPPSSNYYHLTEQIIFMYIYIFNNQCIFFLALTACLRFLKLQIFLLKIIPSCFCFETTFLWFLL